MVSKIHSGLLTVIEYPFVRMHNLYTWLKDVKTNDLFSQKSFNLPYLNVKNWFNNRTAVILTGCLVFTALFFTKTHANNPMTHSIQQTSESTIKQINPEGYYVTLQDGSTYIMNWWNAWGSYKWNKEEKIRIDETDQGIYLTNLTQSSTIHATLAPDRSTTPFRHYVDSISEHGQTIKLKDGMTWNVAWNMLWGLYKTNSCEIVKTWEPDDEIGLHTEVHGNESKEKLYYLTNMRTLETVVVSCTEQMQKPVAFQINAIDGCNITLSNGTVWDISKNHSWCGRNRWKLGDSILIYTDLSLNHYLVNYERCIDTDDMQGCMNAFLVANPN